MTIILVGFPYLILEISLGFNYDSSEWLSFYSSYLTGIIGALGVILTIYFTIRNSNKERENSRKQLDKEREESEKQFNNQIRVNRMPYVVAESSVNEIESTYILRIGETSNEYYEYDLDMLLTNIGYGLLTNFTVDWYAIYEENNIQTNKLLSPNIPVENSIRKHFFNGDFNSLFKSVLNVEDTLELRLIIYSSIEIDRSSSTRLTLSCSYFNLFGDQYTQTIPFKAIAKDVNKREKYQLIVDTKSIAQSSPRTIDAQ